MQTADKNSTTAIEKYVSARLEKPLAAKFKHAGNFALVFLALIFFLAFLI